MNTHNHYLCRGPGECRETTVRVLLSAMKAMPYMTAELVEVTVERAGVWGMSLQLSSTALAATECQEYL